MIVKITPKRKNMFVALTIRMLMLLMIALFAEKLPAYGFIGNTADYDDYRYEQGAVMYAEQANGIIDVEAFTRIFDSMGDWTGHHLQPERILTEGCLWYWIVCILTYLTKWRWWIRILNIVLSVFITKYVYELAEVLFSEKTAKTASLVYAIFPYSVVFTCFSYKDTLVSFCILYIVLFSIRAKRKYLYTKRDVVGLIVTCMVFVLTRSGLSEIWIGLCLLYYLEVGRRIPAKKVLGIFFLIVFGLIMTVEIWDLLLYKFLAYTGNSTMEGLSGGALVKITRIQDIWKLPFTVLFSIIQPIGFSGKIDSWYSLVRHCNIIMCPIAISAILEVVTRRRNDKFLSIILLGFYTLCSVTSVLIFRQLFSVWPIPVIYGCNYLTHSKADKIILVIGVSIILSVALIAVVR